MDGIHFGHFGEVKSVRRAKSSIYWLGCDDQIRNMVASCSSCKENRHKNPALPFSHPPPGSSVSDGVC